MSQGKKLARLAALMFGVLAVGAAQSTGFDRPLGELYNTRTTNELCAEAQRIVTATGLDVSNVIYAVQDGFVQSDAVPYSVEPEGAVSYDPPEEPDLPLGSTQFVDYGLTNSSLAEIPTFFACKMKNAQYLNAAGLATDAVDQPCKAVNAFYLDEVLASLPRFVRKKVEGNVILEEDVTVNSGQDWTSVFPYPVIYRETEGGPLRIKSSALFVSPLPDDIFFPPLPPANFPGGSFVDACENPIIRGFLGSACEPRKWGVRYCQLAPPAYIRAALTGRIDVPILPEGPPDPGAGGPP